MRIDRKLKFKEISDQMKLNLNTVRSAFRKSIKQAKYGEKCLN